MRFEMTDGNGRDLSSFVSVTRNVRSGEEGMFDIRVSRDLDRVRIEWTERMLGHVSLWHPTCGRDRRLPQFFCGQKTRSCFFSGAPVLATVRADGRVHRAVALGDASVSSSVGYYVDDFSENDTVIFSVELYNINAGFSTRLFIGLEGVPLADALGRVWRMWNTDEKRAAPLPESAFEPLYSTWYSYHQTPDQAALTEELRLASELGFKTVILDDGWQIEGAGTKDYRKSGDWAPAPDKFPDFAGFVRDAHSFGQKLVLWFAVPFAGFDTEAFRRFNSKLLFSEESFFNAGTLDIRYPEVREYIVSTYIGFIEKYDIDGFKLDFIDHFSSARDIPAFGGGMDAPTVTQAVKMLLEEICSAAVKLKTDLLMEFRQYYVGPDILRFANMLRVGDCAFDAVTNRTGVADLRMMTRDIAVHSDMLLFSPDETPENCALQLLNIMFAVPQISVRLARAGEAQRRLIKAYLEYWEKNRDILLGGRFGVKHPETCYSAIWADNAENGRRIAVLYAESAWRVTFGEEDIWNATGEDTVAVLNGTGGGLLLTVYDCFGEEVDRFSSDSPAAGVRVPVGGRVSVKAQPG